MLHALCVAAVVCVVQIAVADADKDESGQGWRHGGYAHEGWHGDIHVRMHETAERIRSAVDRGQISEHEAHPLFRDLHDLREHAQRINTDLDRLNHHISRETHEEQAERELLQ
jgi:hypothetical protein